jgi:predicted metal-binding membrane protein
MVLTGSYLRKLVSLHLLLIKASRSEKLADMETHGPLEELLKRDRRIILAGLSLVSLLAWAYMLDLAAGMHSSMGMGAAIKDASMPKMNAWSITDFLFTFIMWAVMMVAMMIPSAAPTILMFSKFKRQRHKTRNPYRPTGLFILGYLAVWTGYSLLATLAQWGMFSAAMLSSLMGQVGTLMGGAILLVAGIFQQTSLKNACLNHCRTPVSFLLEDWREGGWGAFLMGLEHGSFCTVCCWALMTLMFVAGVMNVFWMALIAVLILVEKLMPAGDWFGRLAGFGMGIWGILLITSIL